jgi:hypothetical protein
MKKKVSDLPFNNKHHYYRLPVVFRRISLYLILVTIVTFNVRAQDPVLPATNLGLANVFDAISGKPGLVYQSYIQFFQTNAFYDQDGNKSPSDLKINSLLQMNQLIYLSPVKVLGGNLGFTILVPIVQINSTSPSGPAPSTSSAVLGDPLLGVAAQWSGKKLFKKSISHRLEFDVSIPAGSYSRRYIINPSAHFWNYELYYTSTIMLNKVISVSARHQFNYNSHIINEKAKAGTFYNGNYSVDYAVLPTFRIAAVAYFLQQVNQDSYDGDNHYYQDQFAIHNTKERILAYGPGISYFTPRGVFFEVKVFFETAAKNRFSGTRPTMRMVIPLSK